DEELLGLEFQYLASLDIDLDLSVTGFDLPEIDVLIQSQGQAERDSTADEIPAVEAAAVTQLGDIWQIGWHRLVCGDATDAAVYGLLLGDERAQMVFTDPPYNVPVDGHVGGLGKTRHREFAMAAGEMDPAAFAGFLTNVFRNLASHSQDGSLHFQCMDWRHMPEILAAGAAAYSELKNLCVWAKTNGGMGSLYQSRHELVFVFKSGTGSHINNVELGRHGRYRTNVWEYPGVNTFGAGREDLALHPTVKPVAMVADAILDCSRRRGIVLDAFAGSGTTLIAAERTGRLGRAIELDPLYCDVILRRLQRVCGLQARLADQDLTFDQAQAQRLAEVLEAAE
ncbi:MAG: site-specific DNA-methyltransferase, partial [Sphingomonadales bacterium]